MPQPSQREDGPVIIRFGGGVNSEGTDTGISESECTLGENFELRLGSTEFQSRNSFDLVNTAPNTSAIRGAAQVVKADGTVSQIVQAGNIVYSWDGQSSFTQVSTVNPNARLRGPKFQIWPLGTPKVIISDLALIEPVKTWDGTTFTDLTHDLTDLKARYCLVQNERVFFANVDTGSATPHVVLASKRSDETNYSSATRGGTAGAGVGDAFFFNVPDLNYINGIVDVFGEIAISTRRGRIYRITGDNTAAMAISELFPDSGATGDEPITFIGNDIAFGRPGKLETLFSTSKFGDVDSDDLSRQIKNLVAGVTNWSVYYNSTNQKVYFFAPDQRRVYVYHKSLLDPDVRRIEGTLRAPRLSPWSVWTTAHGMNFQPTAVWVMRNPLNDIETVYMGGSAGEIWKLEGDSGTDGGTTNVTAFRTSKVFELGDAEIFDITGYVAYRPGAPQTLTLTFQHGGHRVFDQPINVALEAPSQYPVWGTVYWSGFHWNAEFEKRLRRRRISAAGASNQVQIKASITGSASFDISEIGLTIQAVRPGAT